MPQGITQRPVYLFFAGKKHSAPGCSREMAVECCLLINLNLFSVLLCILIPHLGLILHPPRWLLWLVCGTALLQLGKLVWIACYSIRARIIPGVSCLMRQMPASSSQRSKDIGSLLSSFGLAPGRQTWLPKLDTQFQHLFFVVVPVNDSTCNIFSYSSYLRFF